MGYAEYPVHSALREWVKCFWSIADGPSEDVQEVWPDGCVELILTPGNTFRVNDEGMTERFPRAVVIGLQPGIMRVRAEGEVRLLGARMLPFRVEGLATRGTRSARGWGRAVTEGGSIRRSDSDC